MDHGWFRELKERQEKKKEQQEIAQIHAEGAAMQERWRVVTARINWLGAQMAIATRKGDAEALKQAVMELAAAMDERHQLMRDELDSLRRGQEMVNECRRVREAGEQEATNV